MGRASVHVTRHAYNIAQSPAKFFYEISFNLRDVLEPTEKKISG